MTASYDNSESFRQALQARLRNVAADRGVSVQDLQLRFLMERLLARLFHEPTPPWILKGGFAMELRYRPRARTTRDIDLTVSDANESPLDDRIDAIREKIQEAAAIELGDHLDFRVGSARGELPGAPAGGARFPIDALIAGRTFGRFHLDVGFGDPISGDPEELVGDDLLAFAGIAPARALAIPKPQQFAEKLHAYTYRWTDRDNTRVKDLVDLVLFIERGELDQATVVTAVHETFARRGTHPVPDTLDPPPPSWTDEFPPMAEQAGLTTTDALTAFALLTEYWNARPQ